MKSSLLAAVAGFLVAAVGGAQPAGVPAANQGVGPARLASPAGVNLEVRYARAQLRLAEVNLAQAVRSNQRLAGIVSADVLGEFREAVEVARVELAAALAGRDGDPFAAWQRRAEARSRTAQGEWQNAVAANQQIAHAVDPSDVERLKARADVLRLEYERGLQRVDASPAERAQWQLSLLAADVDRLREESLRSVPGGRMNYYRWR